MYATRLATTGVHHIFVQLRLLATRSCVRKFLIRRNFTDRPAMACTRMY